MKTSILCLANSKKWLGRCLAGYKIQILQDGSPDISRAIKEKAWMRPVTSAEHGQIPIEYVSTVSLLDIVTFDVLAPQPYDYQSENVLVNERSIVATQNIKGSPELYEQLTDESSLNLFGNKRGDVTVDEIKQQSHSLMFIRAFSPKVVENSFNKGHFKLRFTYHGNSYFLSITDLAFIEKFKQNQGILDERSFVYVTVSLGEKFIKTNLYYKLVAAIIF